MSSSKGHKAYNKGVRLEKDFAVWMKNNLGYHRILPRQFVRGKVASRPFEVDLYGIKESPFWKLFEILGIILVIIALLTMFGELDGVRYYVKDIVEHINLRVRGALIIIGVSGIILGYWGNKKQTKHAWVECKNLSTNVKRDHIFKLNSAVKDVMKSNNKTWKPDIVIMVSGKGFDIDALNFARSHNIVCYKQEGKKFKKIL